MNSQGTVAELTRSLERYRGFLGVDPGNADLWLRVGDLEHHLGHFEAARAAFERLSELSEDSAIARGRIAAVLISQQQFAEAAERFAHLIEEGHADAGLYFNLGLSLFYSREFAAARSWFEKAEAAGADAARCRNFRSQCLHHEGQVLQAIEVCRSWLELEPENAEALGYLALLQLDAGNGVNARQLAERVLKLAPESDEAEFVVGTVAIEQHEIEQAEQSLRRILARQPNHSRALFGMGLIHLYRHEHPQAIRDMERALALNPRDLGAWVALGWAKATAFDLTGAELTFRKVIELDRNFAEGYGGLAYALAGQNRVAEAKEAMKSALYLDSGSFGAAAARSVIIAVEGDEERSKRLLAAMLEHKPGPDKPAMIEHIRTWWNKYGSTQVPPPKK